MTLTQGAPAGMTTAAVQEAQRHLPDEVDVIVVGAGAAGCVVAARLSEDPACRVLLLEAGTATGREEGARIPGAAFQRIASDASQVDQTTPQEALGGRRVPLAQGRGLGGGSSINTMSWFQGHPADYDGWLMSGAAGWGWSDVLPYLRRTEDSEFGASDFHGAGGAMAISRTRDLSALALAFVAAGAEQGLPITDDFNGAHREGVGLVQANIRDGQRHSVVDGYLAPAASRENLTVLTGLQVTSLVIDGDRALGVRCADVSGGSDVAHSGAEIRVRRSVILSAGALRSPQLLMLSGIGPAAHLSARGIEIVRDLPGVGSNLHDHPLIVPTWPVTNGSRMLNALNEDDIRAYQLLRRGPLAFFSQAAAMLRTQDGIPGPDIQVFLAPVGLGPDMLPLKAPAVSCALTLLTPHSRGRLRLASANPADPPLIDPHYLAAREDRIRLRQGLQRVRRLFQAPALTAVTGPPLIPPADLDDADLDTWIQDSVTTDWHPVGTCRMGTDPASVVDPADLTVHGIQRLHVVDASVMPAITRGNTQAPTIMIAERAADLLRKQN